MSSKKEQEFEKLFKKNKDSCRKMDLVNVGQGTSGYQGDFTKREIDIIKHEMNGKKTLHLFSGSSTLGEERIDFDNPNATHNGDVFEYLKNYKEKKENPDVVLLDPPYLHDKSIKEYAKTENIYRAKANKPKLKEEDLFHAFNPKKPEETRQLFDMIANNVKPKKIIMKSWNYYVPEGYHDTCRSSAGYSGGYKKTTYLMVLERNDLEPSEKKPIYEVRDTIPIVYEKERDSMKNIEEKDKKEILRDKKTLILDSSVKNPFELVEKSQNMGYDSVLITSDLIKNPSIKLFNSSQKTTKFFKFIRDKLKPKEIIMNTDRFVIPAGYKMEKGKAYISKGCEIPEYLISSKFDQASLEKYNEKQMKAIESKKRKLERTTDPKERKAIEKSIENLISKIK